VCGGKGSRLVGRGGQPGAGWCSCFSAARGIHTAPVNVGSPKRHVTPEFVMQLCSCHVSMSFFLPEGRGKAAILCAMLLHAHVSRRQVKMD